MSTTIMKILGTLSSLYVGVFFIRAYSYKKHGKGKEAISKDLVDLLKE